MSITPAKLVSSCQRRPGQSRFGQTVNTESSGLTVGVSQTGQFAGGAGFGGRFRYNQGDLYDAAHLLRGQHLDAYAYHPALVAPEIFGVPAGIHVFRVPVAEPAHIAFRDGVHNILVVYIAYIRFPRAFVDFRELERDPVAELRSREQPVIPVVHADKSYHIGEQHRETYHDRRGADRNLFVHRFLPSPFFVFYCSA